MALVAGVLAQTAVNVARPEEKAKEKKAVAKQQEKRAQKTSIIEFQGNKAFKETELRSQLKEQINTLDEHGLTPARGDDMAFFLEIFYRKQGYAKVKVNYVIESSDRLRLDIDEGQLTTLGTVTFDGNVNEPADKLFDYAVGPTRERYSKLQKKLPFVAADIEEGGHRSAWSASQWRPVMTSYRFMQRTSVLASPKPTNWCAPPECPWFCLISTRVSGPTGRNGREH